MATIVLTATGRILKDGQDVGDFASACCNRQVNASEGLAAFMAFSSQASAAISAAQTAASDATTAAAKTVTDAQTAQANVVRNRDELLSVQSDLVQRAKAIFADLQSRVPAGFDLTALKAVINDAEAPAIQRQVAQLEQQQAALQAKIDALRAPSQPTT